MSKKTKLKTEMTDLELQMATADKPRKMTNALLADSHIKQSQNPGVGYGRYVPIRSYSLVYDEKQFPSLCDVSQQNDTDINTITQRYFTKGIVPQAVKKGVFTDQPFPNLMEAYQAIRESRLIFDSLPSEIRASFQNEPHNLFSFLESTGTGLNEFLENPKNFHDYRAEPKTPTEVPSDPQKSDPEPTKTK